MPKGAESAHLGPKEIKHTHALPVAPMAIDTGRQACEAKARRVLRSCLPSRGQIALDTRSARLGNARRAHINTPTRTSGKSACLTTPLERCAASPPWGAPTDAHPVGEERHHGQPARLPLRRASGLRLSKRIPRLQPCVPDTRGLRVVKGHLSISYRQLHRHYRWLASVPLSTVHADDLVGGERRRGRHR